MMEGKPAIYLGRIVKKENFRTFIYGANGQKRLVESWDEFEATMESGLWFATLEQASEKLEVVKPVLKKKPKSKAKSEPILESDDLKDVLPDDGSVIEVKDDF